jgi:hypothetical protein
MDKLALLVESEFKQPLLVAATDDGCNYCSNYSSSTRRNIFFLSLVVFVRHIRVLMVDTASSFPTRHHPSIPPRRTQKESLAFPEGYAQCKQGPQR